MQQTTFKQPPTQDDKLRERLSRCTDLPSPPGVAARIIELGQDPSADMGTVAEAVSVDPALTAKILRMANSPLYARGRKTENLRQAITMFGLNTTLTLALSFSLVNALRDRPSKGIDYSHFWRRSLAAATCCKIMSAQLNLGKKEELFLGGLLQDMGMLALDKVIPELYTGLEADQADHTHVQRLEREAIGEDHAAAGAWLLEHWNLPQSLVCAVAGSHDPSLVPADSEHSQFARCVAVSGLVADIICGDEHERATQAAALSTEKLLGVDRATLCSTLERVGDELQETCRVFDVDLGDVGLMNSLLAQANEILMLRNLQSIEEAAQLRSTAESLESRTRELEEKARRDGLTKLYNRAQFDKVIHEEFAAAKQHSWPLAVVFIDLDHFKKINDTYGHGVGDQVLMAAADLLQTSTRESDIVVRYGGEEFVVVLPGTGLEGARVTCDRIINAFCKAKHNVSGGEQLVVTASLGVAVQGEGASFEGHEQLLQAADRAVYVAKAQGRNQYVIYDQDSF